MIEENVEDVDFQIISLSPNINRIFSKLIPILIIVGNFTSVAIILFIFVMLKGWWLILLFGLFIGLSILYLSLIWNIKVVRVGTKGVYCGNEFFEYEKVQSINLGMSFIFGLASVVVLVNDKKKRFFFYPTLYFPFSLFGSSEDILKAQRRGVLL